MRTSAAVIVVDALQVSARYSGVGRQALSIGADLHRLPESFELELRCSAESLPLLAPAFPPRTRHATPLRRSRPRARRIFRQQVVEPARDPASTLLVCLGDQGPLWGRARTLLVVNDVRRIVHPATSGLLERSYYRALVPRAVRHASTVVTVSEFSRGEIERTLGVRVRLVADHPQPKVEAASRRDSGPLLLVGALRPYKGIETAIDALGLLPEELRPRLLMAGPTEGRRAELSSYAVSRNVAAEILDWVPDARLDELYRSALGTVCPSTYEGYGINVAESLAYGLPTVASDIPPHREVAGDHGALFFPASDAAQLAERLRLVLEDETARRRLAERALERSRELQGKGPRWADVILAAAESGTGA